MGKIVRVRTFRYVKKNGGGGISTRPPEYTKPARVVVLKEYPTQAGSTFIGAPADDSLLSWLRRRAHALNMNVYFESADVC